MITSWSEKHGILGKGITEEDAIEDCYLYIARNNIEDDVTGKYKRRRAELHAWFPLPNVMMIKGVTGVMYENGAITNLRTKETLYCTPHPYAQYMHLYYLLGHDISFTDFTVAIREEVDIFLNRISPLYGNLKDFPQIQPGNLTKCLYLEKLDLGCLYGKTDVKDELLVCSKTEVVSVSMGSNINKDCALAYAFAKLGYIYDGRKVVKC